MLVKILKRLRRKHSIRAKISWTTVKPRLSVFRSNANIYAQIIDDTSWKTLCSSSDLKLDRNITKTQRAQKVWEDIATKAKWLNITDVVFDRGWFAYHGRVEALASSARTSWLKF
jgi:large subunit ribosomal protein L18